MLQKILNAFYSVLRSNLTCEPGASLQPIFIARGGRVRVGESSIVRFGTILIPQSGYINIGRRTSINHYCIINGLGGVEIGDDCQIAADVKIFSHNHNFMLRSKKINQQGLSSKGVLRIGNDVWIGTGAIILDGVQIGDGAVVGAGSVVTKDLEPYGVYVGNPARKIAEREG